MKKSIVSIALGLGIIILSSFVSNSTKLTSQKTHITFFSHTVAEDITANNYKTVSTLEKETGQLVFSVPMQSFEFEKALMQKHFNSPKFLDTKKFPKAKMTGVISNLKEVNFDKDGTYSITVQGEMTIHGETNPISEKGELIVKGKSIELKSKFNLTLADYKIGFEKGKPATNIAKTVEISVDAFY
jgi:polyisoprenoid-binding protein YceI